MPELHLLPRVGQVLVERSESYRRGGNHSGRHLQDIVQESMSWSGTLSGGSGTALADSRLRQYTYDQGCLVQLVLVERIPAECLEE